MKKFVAPLVLSVALVLTGCSGAETASPNSETPAASHTAEPTPVVETPPIPDLVGGWKSDAAEGSYQQATITGNAITVDWVSDGGATVSVYWVGTFQAPTDTTEPYVWTSQRAAAATDGALLASTDDTKEFTYAEGTISYAVSALGTTRTVALHQD